MAEYSEIDEIYKQWIEDLRSGKYKPCKTYFRKSENEFDPMGLLLNIIDPTRWKKSDSVYEFVFTNSYESCSSFNDNHQILSDLGMERASIHVGEIFNITEKKSLDQIYELTAKYIEEEMM